MKRLILSKYMNIVAVIGIVVSSMNVCASELITVGNEFQLNTYISSHQGYPSCAMDNNGRVVYTWQSDWQDGSQDSVYTRIFDSDATPLTGEIKVNTYSSSYQRSAQIAINKTTGDFVITWVSDGQDGSGEGVYAQRFDSNGNKIGAEFQVNTYISDNQFPRDIAMNSSGDFIIIWDSNGQDGSDRGVYAQRFDSNGNKVGTEFQVNTYTTGYQMSSGIAMNSSGNFITVWQSDGQDGSGYGVYSQRYDSNGNEVGSETLINSTTTGHQSGPRIAMNDSGSYVITWQDNSLSDYDVKAQRFDSNGNTLGSEILVNTYTTNDQSTPCIAIDNYGNFIIGWQSTDQDGYARGMYAQRFDPIGNPIGDEFYVNAYTNYDTHAPYDIDMNDNGNIAFAYTSYPQDGSGSGAYGRMFFAEPASVPILSLEPSEINVNRNQDVEIAINISDASGVVGYRIALDLDPSKVTYVPGSATKVGTSTENGWGPLVVNSSSPEIAIFTCASATDALASGAGSLMKFQLHVNETLADFTPISVSFTPLTSLNEDAIAYSTEIWSATVLGPNHIPTFTGGANEVVLEDSGAHEIIGWATDISPGIAYESWQDLNFTLDIDNASLFFVQPTIDASGALRYTLASDEYGICNATAVLHDSGGTANGGIDSSTPYIFSITADPVNDAPSFIAGATAVVLNATGGQHTFPAWATAISTGPANESSQIVWFDVETSNPELFSASPTIDAGGTLRFTPNVNTHGVFDATATLFDSGGIANGGINHSPAQQFVIKIYIPFMWGDLNDNAQAGSVDASLLLQFNAELIDSFPGYPVLDYPEYYPDPMQPWLNFPIAADVNDDDVAGTLDASLVLQKYALLIDWFPADTDHDQWGPDEPLPAGKVSKRQTARNMNVLFEQQDSSWIVTFQIDNADDVQGLRIDLSYNPEQLQFNGAASGWLVPSGLLAVNDSEPGRLILSGALGTPLQQGQSNLMSVKFDLSGALTEPLLIQVDEQQTLVNDGQIRINLNYPE